MTRISEKDAIRLGLIPPAALSGGAKARPQRSAAPAPKRVSHKGGRLRRDGLYGPFELIFTVPFEPKTKHRARTHLPKAEIENAFMRAQGNISAFRSMMEKIKHHSYTPEETKAFEDTVAVLATSAMRGQKQPYSGPVNVVVTFILGGDPELWPTDVTDPDLDNMEKAICDAMNGIVWKDDRLLVSKSSIKVCGETPSIHLRISAADPLATNPA